MFDFKEIHDKLIKADNAGLINLVKKSLEEDVTSNDILNRGLIAGMEIVGQRMEEQEMFIPDVLQAAKAMKERIAELESALAEAVLENRMLKTTLEVASEALEMDIKKNFGKKS